MKKRSRGSTSTLAAAALLLVVLSPAPAQSSSTECTTPILPVSELERGMEASGLTVSSGTDPEPFSAEILGVLKDGVGPGRDMIVIDAHSEAIDAAGGIWSGMSGSPVYVEGKLVGAVAFGLSLGPSTVGGVTPAEDMVDVLDYPSLGATAASSSEVSHQFTAGSQTVAVPRFMKSRIARAAGTTVSQVGNSLTRLELPLSISGAGERLGLISRAIRREHLSLIPYAGSSASPPPAAPSALPEPGGNLAAALSYGDVTSAAVGTLTLVCGGQGMAFGHPFLLRGASALGANAADAITIVDDPVFGSFKLANIEGLVGSVDQDRLAGVRADFTGSPAPIPITSTTAAPELSRIRDGETDAVDSDFVPFLASVHLLANIDSTFDEVGPGTSDVSWTVTGTREDGSGFELRRSNLYASRFDVSVESIFELMQNLFVLLDNKFEQIEFTGVDLRATVDSEVRSLQIKRVLVSVGRRPFAARHQIRVRPGQRIRLRVLLQPFEGNAVVPRRVSLAVPRHARQSGALSIGNRGESGGLFFLSPEGEFAKPGKGASAKPASFDDLLSSIKQQPHNNDLIATLRLGHKTRTDRRKLDGVVSGHKLILVRLIGGRKHHGGPLPAAARAG